MFFLSRLIMLLQYQVEMLKLIKKFKHLRVIKIAIFCCTFLLISVVVLYSFQRNSAYVASHLGLVNKLAMDTIRLPLQGGEMSLVERRLANILKTYDLSGIEVHNPEGMRVAAFGVKKELPLKSLTYGAYSSWEAPFFLIFQHSDIIFHDYKPLGFLISCKRADSSVFWLPALILVIGLLGQALLWKFLFSRSSTGNTSVNLGHTLPEKPKNGERLNVRKSSEDLRLERDQAVASVEAKNRFIASMSHEIRSSLNGVIGVLALLKKSELDEERMRLVHAASQSADSLLVIINDMLDFTKVESGRIEFEKIPFDLRDLVEESITLFVDSAREKGLNLHCYMPVGIATKVIGDPTRLRQTLTNLLSNAIKFTRKGEVNLLLTTMGKSSGSQRICFTVEDTGIGVDPEKVDDIFDIFAQADVSTTRNYGGSGVGLNICKQLVEQQGGEIGARSNHGRGAIFWFTLEFEIDLKRNLKSSWPQLQQKKVLILEDCETCTTIVNQYLKETVSMVRTIESDDDVVTKLIDYRLEGFTPDILIIDHGSLREKTEGVLEKIHTICGASTPKIFLFSWQRGSITPGIRQRIGGVIAKPVFLHNLCDILVGNATEDFQTIALQDDVEINGRVLLVDDEEINLHVGAQILKKLGCRIDTAASGNEALQKTADNKYHLVLMDVQMPDLSGIETAVLIRKREEETQAPRLSIVALTANGLEETRQRCFAAGMDGFIVKPIHPELLRKELFKWLPGNISDTQVGKSLAGLEKNGTDSAEQGTWDRTTALEYLGGDEQLLNDLMKMFLQRKDQLIDNLENSMATGNGDEISSAAHAFKGAVNHFAAERCRKLAQTIETRAAQEQLDDLEKIYQDLSEATDALVEELRQQVWISQTEEHSQGVEEQ